MIEWECKFCDVVVPPEEVKAHICWQMQRALLLQTELKVLPDDYKQFLENLT